MKRRSESQDKVAEASGLGDEAFVKKYPGLTEHLVAATFEDGTEREPSTLTFSAKDGSWQMAINDREEKASLYSIAPTMVDCLKLAEKALADGVDAWRPWGGNKKKKGK